MRRGIIIGLAGLALATTASPTAGAPRLPELVCVETRGYYVGYIRPRRCLVDRPGASNSETLNLINLDWTSWNRARATATGEDLGEHPGQIGSTPVKVRIVAHAPGRDPTTGAPIFRRLTEYSSRTPHGHTVPTY